MSPLAKAKGLLIEEDSDKGSESMDPLEEAKAAFKEGDFDGAVEAIAAYVDACMKKGE